MKYKTFLTSTIKEAMKEIHQELGEEAIILDTQFHKDIHKYQVTAAVEKLYTAEPLSSTYVKNEENKDHQEDIYEKILSCLEYHATPAALTDKLLRAASFIKTNSAVQALTKAFEQLYTFNEKLEENYVHPKIFIGPAGTGKTITTAKFVARAVINQQPVHVITIDTQKAGGIEQLEAFTTIMNLELHVVYSPEFLHKIIREIPKNHLIVIDTNAVNPYSSKEMDMLNQFIHAAHAEPILVLPAGGDADEMADIAIQFKKLHARNFIITRSDVVKRLGSILWSCDLAQLTFSMISLSPHIAEGLEKMSAHTLTKILFSTFENAQTINHHIRGSYAVNS